MRTLMMLEMRLLAARDEGSTSWSAKSGTSNDKSERRMVKSSKESMREMMLKGISRKSKRSVKNSSGAMKTNSILCVP